MFIYITHVVHHIYAYPPTNAVPPPDSMTYCKPSSLPMEPCFLSCLAHMISPILIGVAKDVYPSLMGNMEYAVVCTRPDVSTAFSILGCAQSNPTEAHIHALKTVYGTLTSRGYRHARGVGGRCGPQPPTYKLRGCILG
jgi:hypothetical protein